jgi:hypothetical protein
MSEDAEEAKDSLTTGISPEHRAICLICFFVLFIAPQQIQYKDNIFLNINERFEVFLLFASKYILRTFQHH